jgi:hypothetical protein
MARVELGYPVVITLLAFTDPAPSLSVSRGNPPPSRRATVASHIHSHVCCSTGSLHSLTEMDTTELQLGMGNRPPGMQDHNSVWLHVLRVAAYWACGRASVAECLLPSCMANVPSCTQRSVGRRSWQVGGEQGNQVVHWLLPVRTALAYSPLTCKHDRRLLRILSRSFLNPTSSTMSLYPPLPAHPNEPSLFSDLVPAIPPSPTEEAVSLAANLLITTRRRPAGPTFVLSQNSFAGAHHGIQQGFILDMTNVSGWSKLEDIDTHGCRGAAYI